MVCKGVEHGQDRVQGRGGRRLARKGFDDFARGCLKHVCFEMDARSRDVVLPAQYQVDVQFFCKIRRADARFPEFVAHVFFVNRIDFGDGIIGVDIPFGNAQREMVPLRVATDVFMGQYGDVPLRVDGRVDQDDEDAELEEFFHVLPQVFIIARDVEKCRTHFVG